MRHYSQWKQLGLIPFSQGHQPSLFLVDRERNKKKEKEKLECTRGKWTSRPSKCTFHQFFPRSMPHWARESLEWGKRGCCQRHSWSHQQADHILKHGNPSSEQGKHITEARKSLDRGKVTRMLPKVPIVTNEQTMYIQFTLKLWIPQLDGWFSWK